MEWIITNIEFSKFISFYKNHLNSIEIPVKSREVTFANELLSIIENAGLMGVPIPTIIMNAIDILKEKSGGIENDKWTNYFY